MSFQSNTQNERENIDSLNEQAIFETYQWNFLWIPLICILVIFMASKEKQIQVLNKQMFEETSYEKWKILALQKDELEGWNKWKKKKSSQYYDSAFIETKLVEMQRVYKLQDIHGIVSQLREGLLRNLVGINNSKLYLSSIGTKELIEKYIDEVVKQLNFICDNEFKDMSTQKRFTFFYETRQSYGRSALLLSGGATLGIYHLGVIKALFEFGLLPRVISGSSVGSIMASVVGVSTDKELKEVLDINNSALNLEAFDRLNSGNALKRKLIRFLKKGVLMDIRKLEECVKTNLGNYTFKEAYDKTGRILNITVASINDYEHNRLLNYLTAPNVLIWSAACASCALWGLFEPVELMAKDENGNIVPYHPSGLKWSDGSVGTDLPMKRLAELFNINFFIVSQVNPHMIPFLNLKYNIEKKSKFIQRGFYFFWSELKHRILQMSELGLIPNFFKGIIPVVNQKYEGDITIVPHFNLKDYFNIISNPNQAIIGECIRIGMIGTRPKMSHIHNALKIEMTLEKCVAKLRKQLYPDGNFPKWNQ